ncbi:hypothetical protein ACJVC5_06730 [Peredibacter sp. HCB2-198]|uniref:hypothetical protein n=1 Tax=Peredibacter sp. HCB2-198 TaxID=3383025 RepID=UPI0038B5C29A
MKQFIIYFSLLISPLALAEEKHLYVMGAGGEPAGDDTIFDRNVKTLGKFSSNSNWKTTVSVNGGHSKTESIVRNGFSGSKNLGSFKQESYDQMLNDMLTKMNNGTLKSGDKLMVVIESHGAQHRGDQKSHEIAFAGGTAQNLDDLKGAPMTSLDRLEEVVKLAEQKGVKLAILDMSCYSGNTVKLAGPKTCVVSSSGTDHASYNSGPISFSKTFSESMLSNLKEGRNLEDLYINAKDGTKEPEYPMISTEAGQIASKYLYEMILPQLLYNQDIKNHFTRQYGKTSEELNARICEIDNKFEEANTFLKDLEKVNSKFPNMGGISTSSLRAALAEYRQFQKGYEAGLLNVAKVEQSIKSELATRYAQDANLFGSESGTAILNANYDYSLESEQKYLVELNSPRSRNLNNETSLKAMVASAEKRIRDIQRKKQIQQELVSKFAAEYKSRKESFNKTYTGEQIEQTYKLADRVTKEAKKVYSELYRQNMSAKNNPCRDFKL